MAFSSRSRHRCMSMYGSCVLGGLAGGVADNTCGAGVCVQCSVEQNRRKRSTAGAAERAQRL